MQGQTSCPAAYSREHVQLLTCFSVMLYSCMHTLQLMKGGGGGRGQVQPPSHSTSWTLIFVKPEPSVQNTPGHGIGIRSPGIPHDG